MISHPIKSVSGLAEAGLIAKSEVLALAKVAARYAVGVTGEIASLIDPADPLDPIARQFIPSQAELVTTPEERADPIGDSAHSPVPGIVHRHPDRVLFTLVHICPVYCRFCFRRESVGPQGEAALSPEGVDRAIAYIESHPEIWRLFSPAAIRSS
jgi:lysine 2,3-aminomutase